ncbi:MAG: hypothetical protein G01um101444_141 [Parcubacteria group bacterium Gr01-1014_44]|nr:MAG: hypothetical protein G01um101444_141 [Parcubacteria group bacterium Gr01-1014_44]
MVIVYKMTMLGISSYPQSYQQLTQEKVDLVLWF